MIGAAAGPGVAVVVDDNRDRISVIPVGVGDCVLVLNVACIVEVSIQIGQGPRDRTSGRSASKRQVAVGSEGQITAGRSRKRDRQVAASCVDVAKVHG